MTKPPPDWGAIEREVSNILHDQFGGREVGVVNEVRFLIENELIVTGLGWPSVVHAEIEFPVPRGRIDLMLFHADDSGTDRAHFCGRLDRWAADYVRS